MEAAAMEAAASAVLLSRFGSARAAGSAQSAEQRGAGSAKRGRLCSPYAAYSGAAVTNWAVRAKPESSTAAAS
eukprot:4362447-Prymnesium_polylepis.1